MLTHSPTDKNVITDLIENIKGMSLEKKEGQLVTGGCCQWRGSASYDSDVVYETFVLIGKYSDEPPNSTPPERYGQV